ncbi:SGNH hydrolase domain-containing protein [Actinoplanes sp. NPDC051411]|uniref:SGNH hydrolase domain-containing protein n=1 Tax=Actinoplanes sp. NPDC051411 TaxID=3155522 RepID=UPI0034141B7D
MTKTARHGAAGTSHGTFRRDVEGIAVALIMAMAAGLLTGCSASETPGPRPAARLSLTKVLAAVRRAPAIRALPSDLSPSLTAAGQDLGFDSDRCEAGPTATRIDACVFGDPASSTRVVLTGDSHASMWLPALSEIAQRQHWQLTFYGKPACPAPDITFWNQRLGRAFTECDRFRSFAEEQIRASRPDLVLVADSSYAAKTGPGESVTATEWQGGLTRTLAGLRRSGARAVVIGDIPVLAESAPECLAAHARNIVTCFTTRAVATARVFNDADEAAARATGSGYVSVLPWLCGAVCTPVVGKVLVYRDRFTLTAAYSRLLNGVLEDALAREFPQENAP